MEVRSTPPCVVVLHDGEPESVFCQEAAELVAEKIVRCLSVPDCHVVPKDGNHMEAVLEGMAEYYSVELSQKIRRGLDINAQKCLHTGGNIALGFYVDSDKRFQRDPETDPVVEKIFQMYVRGDTMAEIIRYLNTQHMKTSYGKEFTKNSLHRILRNKRYIGIYTYRDMEITGGVPRIISDELFYEAQEMMDKKKKAPARAKASESYILTTKLFCGYCGSAMTGVSGKGRGGKRYYYYQCVANRRDKSCKKKTVTKWILEDLVITETRKMLTKENIERIAAEVVQLCEKECNTDNLKRLQKLLRENNRATENLFKALESGQLVDVIAERITQKREERKELEQQIAIEEAKHMVPTINEVKFFLNQFRKGDINDMKYRQALVDTFINRIYLYDKQVANQHSADANFSVQESGFAQAKNAMWDHFKTHGQSLFSGDIKHSLLAMRADFFDDLARVQESKESMDTARRNIDSHTSDVIMGVVVDKYKASLLEAKERISASTKLHWQQNAQSLKEQLISIVTESDALSSSQREQLSNIIMDYKPLEFNDDADDVFIKTKFLRGNIWGILVGDSERLNIRRLAAKYNERMFKNIMEMAMHLNDSYAASYKIWQTLLLTIIEQNIAEYNPQLRDMTEMIREETEKILELENDQQTISASLEAIRQLMSWKDVEFEEMQYGS